jgi:hypothetical protein
MLNRQMKRAITIGALVALLATTAAFAATKTYRGAIKGDLESSVTVKVKRASGERSVKLFAAEHFVISCESGPKRLERAALSGLVPVNRRGKFDVEGSDEGRTLRVAGKLVGKRSAKGTVRYLGPTPVGDSVEDCDSGRLNWSASR